MDITDSYKEFDNMLDTIASFTQGGSISEKKYRLKSLYILAEKHFNNIKKGDRVRIVKEINIPEKSGWSPFREQLKVGQDGIVMERRYNQCTDTCTALVQIEWTPKSRFDKGIARFHLPISKLKAIPHEVY